MNRHICDYWYNRWQIATHFANLRGTIEDYQEANMIMDRYIKSVWEFA